MSTLQRQQARLGVLLDLEGHTPVTVAFPRSRTQDILDAFERHLAITPEKRADPAVHHDERRKLLGLMVAGLKGRIPSQEWSTTCAMGLVWTALTHPEQGEETRRRIAVLSSELGRATLVLAPGPGDTLVFEVSDVPLDIPTEPPAPGVRP